MSEHSDIMDDVHDKVQSILAEDFVKTVSNLSGNEVKCMRLATILAVSSSLATGASSILAFSAGFFNDPYVSYAAGCSGVIAMVLMKASYYANSQSHYHDAKLKNQLTKDYKFITDFVRDPTSLKPVNEPLMPDPTGMLVSDSALGLKRISQVALEPGTPTLTPKPKPKPKTKKNHKNKLLVQPDQQPVMSPVSVRLPKADSIPYITKASLQRDSPSPLSDPMPHKKKDTDLQEIVVDVQVPDKKGLNITKTDEP
jgi:hypothetical protein